MPSAISCTDREPLVQLMGPVASKCQHCCFYWSRTQLTGADTSDGTFVTTLDRCKSAGPGWDSALNQNGVGQKRLISFLRLILRGGQ